MQVRSLDVKKNIFWSQYDNEELLGPEVLYFSAIGVFIYLANDTRSNIAFPINLLAKYNSPTKRDWNRLKHIPYYLKWTFDMDFFYSNKLNFNSICYANTQVIYLTHVRVDLKGKMFTYREIVISWPSMKQTITAVSSNHVKVLTIHDASQECVVKINDSTHMWTM